MVFHKMFDYFKLILVKTVINIKIIVLNKSIQMVMQINRFI